MVCQSAVLLQQTGVLHPPPSETPRSSWLEAAIIHFQGVTFFLRSFVPVLRIFAADQEFARSASRGIKRGLSPLRRILSSRLGQEL